MPKNRFFRISFLINFFFLLIGNSFSQVKIDKIEPPNWWKGMKFNNIELMIYGENFKDVSVSFKDEKVKVGKITETESGNYLFVELDLSKIDTAGNYQFEIKSADNSTSAIFSINERDFTPESHMGFSQKDVIYLITPDRFSNGDISNDKNIGNLPNQFNRNGRLSRHGGDIQGIINHLEYLKNLGITAIWINPLVENNHPISYHGYAATDFYKIDARFGNNELYKTLVREAHQKGLKIIYDHVSNHISNNHIWVKNPPFANWLHGTPENHINAKHEKSAYFDPNASQQTINNLEKGWFVSEMPDLNQENEFLAKYLIQNTLWWAEFSGFDGIREDTYPYLNPEFASNWAKILLEEYPNFNIVGEVWTGESSYLAGFQANSKVRNFQTNLPVVTDFAIRDAFADFLTKDKSINVFYNLIAHDFLYQNPNNLLTFVDNHDVERPMLLAKENLQKVKLAFVFLLTARGIPQLFYGDEIGLVGGYDHGDLRQDFPGGWEEDSHNAFLEKERNSVENETFNHLQKLIKIRKENEAFSIGKTEHFEPIENVYFYFRTEKENKFLVILNGNDKKTDFDLSNIIDFENSKLIDIYNKRKIDSKIIELCSYDFKIIRVK